MVVSLRAETALKPSVAFQTFTDELCLALHRLGVEFDPGPKGTIRGGGKELGRVVSWKPGKLLTVAWHHMVWDTARESKIRFRFQGTKRGTTVTVYHTGWSAGFAWDQDGALGWFADQVAAPFLDSLREPKLGDWLTDRNARRPTGMSARTTYANPIYHRPNFRAILAALQLSVSDKILDVGCGGGAFLKDALKSGCTGAGVDHSAEMVRLARKINSTAVTSGRLQIREGEAECLPFEDSTFSCTVMTGVLGFIPDPAKAFAEMFRVLARGGRLVVFTSTKKLKGTPAAPEPLASRIRFYEDSELKRMATAAGFAFAKVEHPDFVKLGFVEGVPKRDRALFAGREGQLLIAKKE
ncbi:MAG TPA: methyltransferase domain-containing protein [Nitrososphaerales archaeon]|nr:methyltransferase domain-containing protein [Nitrososphaerales archaeon]